MSYYKPNNIYQKSNDESISDTETLYTVSGSEDELYEGLPVVLKDGDAVCAKKIRRKDGTLKYMVRLATDGKLYNPVSIYGEEKNNTFLDRVCRSNDKFKQVSAKTFEWYVRFLSTKNTSWLHNAERERE